MKRNNILIVGMLVSLTYVLTKKRTSPQHDFTTMATEKGIMITKYKGQAQDVIVPKYLNNQPIVSIAQYAFKDKNLRSVTLPDTIQYIGDWAFANNELTQITLPHALTDIGDWAFYNNKLAMLTLPPKLKVIGNWAFYDNKLTSVVSCQALTHIGTAAFAFNELTAITLPENLHNNMSDGVFHHNPLLHITYENEPSSPLS